MARLYDLFAQHIDSEDSVTASMFSMPHTEKFWDITLPLRVAGALHSLVLNGLCEKLKAVYPPFHENTEDDDLWDAINHAIKSHSDYILPFLDQAPQTNEVRRSAALLPGFLTIAKQTGLPFVLSELGASAGINQCWDKFRYRLDDLQWGDSASPITLSPEWRGKAPPPTADIEIQQRAACDLKPVAYGDPEEKLHLFSYIWADQPDRFTITDRALTLLAVSQY